MNIRLLRILLPACLSLALLPAPASAQLEHLNVDRLIKEMREQGMQELLVRLAQSGIIKDPADAKKLQVEMLIMRAQTRVDDSPAERAVRIESMEKGIAQFQELINSNRENTKRPLWQADMAMHLIYTRMDLFDIADNFYEYGVPNPEQLRAFESGAALATEALLDAVNHLQRLQRELPRDPSYNQTYVNTGRWEEMMDEYLRTRIPFLLGTAAYWTSLLPDSHPYYQNLGKNPNLPLQAANPAAERTRLLNLALEGLNGLPVELTERYGPPARPVNFIKAKLLTQLGRFDEAQAAIDLVIQAAPNDITSFRAMLTRAQAFELKDKKADAAVEFLEGLRDHELAQAGIGFPVIIADLQHRLLMKHAGKDAKKLEEAYGPYDSLLSDTVRLGDRINAARTFVYTRWTQQYGDQPQDTLPPFVLSGMGEMERMLGSELVVKWNAMPRDEAAGAAAQAAAAKVMTQARVHLDKCIDISDALIRREGIAIEVKARARYNKAWGNFLRDPENGQAWLDAARMWTELANDLPDHPLAVEAIGDAMIRLHNLHVREPRPDGVDAAYRATTAVLYEKLPTTHVADDSRLYYTFNVLQADAKYKEAAASYEKISELHRDYVEAQREWIYCHMRMWEQLPEAQRGNQAEYLRGEITRVERLARRAAEDSGEPARIQTFKNTLADLVLSKVELDIYRKVWDEADRALRNFADDFPDDPDLIRMATSRRIMVQVNQGFADEAVKLAKELMESAGDNADRQNAAAATIDAALGELADEIENLRIAADVTKGEIQKREFTERATRQAQASDKLADMLLKWGLDNGAGPEQLFKYRLIKCRSSVLTGKQEEAKGVLVILSREYRDEPRVIFLDGEVLFMTGNDADLKEAVRAYGKITAEEGFRPVKLTSDMPTNERMDRDVLNKLWWQSWFRILQCYDKLKVYPKDIPRLISQLETQYPDLGGPGLRSKFIQLRNKYLNK